MDPRPLAPDEEPTLHGQPRFAPATVAKRLSAVRSFYGYVVDRGTIDASPAVGVKVPRAPRETRGHAITENQVAKLIAAAQDHSDTSEAIVRLLVTNGLNGQVVEIDPETGTQIAARWVDANKAQSPPGSGDLFGLAMTPSGDGFYYVEDEVNMLVLAH